MVSKIPNENIDNRLAMQRAILAYLATVGQPRGDYIGDLPRTGDIVDALGYPRNLILMTLICTVVFFFIMAIRPAPAAECCRCPEDNCEKMVCDCPPGEWRFTNRWNCTLEKVPVDDDERGVVKLADIRAMQKLIPTLKKCEAFNQCLKDRYEGKVKHCYENDRRWRSPW